MLLLLPKFDSGRDLLYNLLKQNVMAKSENVIRGRIGNMIFYRVRGVTRIRSVPLSAVRPDALKCRTARLRLIAAVRFYQRLQDTRLRDIWRMAAKDTAMNGYNLFRETEHPCVQRRTLSSGPVTVGVRHPSTDELSRIGGTDRAAHSPDLEKQSGAGGCSGNRPGGGGGFVRRENVFAPLVG